MTSITDIQHVLDGGGVCILPTETVYGIACHADNAQAVARIYDIKGRNFDKPLAVCVSGLEQAETLAEFSMTARKLAIKFWPGSLTIVAQAKGKSLNAKCYQGDTIALRCPDINWREHLLSKPLALTSANRSGEPDAQTADVDLPVDAILDGGPVRGGVPSTVVSVSNGRIKVFREGAITEDVIKAALKAFDNV